MDNKFVQCLFQLQLSFGKGFINVLITDLNLNGFDTLPLQVTALKKELAAKSTENEEQTESLRQQSEQWQQQINSVSITHKHIIICYMPMVLP